MSFTLLLLSNYLLAQIKVIDEDVINISTQKTQIQFGK